MPNNKWDMGVDLIPATDDTYNLGDSTHKWIINGFELDDACAKDVDSSISDGSTSTNLPTSQAVATFVGTKLVSVSVVGKKLIIG